jgi:cytochrome c-type biogenesis protein CcmI
VFYISALLIVTGVALFVAAPLTGGLMGRKRKTREELEVAHWEHEGELAVQGLRELEFDREMGKLSDADYASLRAALEARALEAMTAVERIKERERAATLAAISAPRQKPQPVAAPAPLPLSAALEPPSPAPSLAAVASSPATSTPSPATFPAVARIGDGAGMQRVRFCPQCGVRVPASGKFCADCGASLRQGERLATRA